MTNQPLSIILHTAEAAVVLVIAILIAYLFPEKRTEVLFIIVALLSAVAKGLRVLPEIPVKDYVNDLGPESESG